MTRRRVAGKLLGATGRFPRGKARPDDEGELRSVITKREDGKIFIDYGKPVSWLALDRNQALELALILLKHCDIDFKVIEETTH